MRVTLLQQHLSLADKTQMKAFHGTSATASCTSRDLQPSLCLCYGSGCLATKSPREGTARGRITGGWREQQPSDVVETVESSQLCAMPVGLCFCFAGGVAV